MIKVARITCPKCGFQKRVQMPTTSCQVVYQCPKCDQILRPKKGDCCVFCSYANVKCPPMQELNSK